MSLRCSISRRCLMYKIHKGSSPTVRPFLSHSLSFRAEANMVVYFSGRSNYAYTYDTDRTCMTTVAFIIAFDAHGARQSRLTVLRIPTWRSELESGRVGGVGGLGIPQGRAEASTAVKSSPCIYCQRVTTVHDMTILDGAIIYPVFLPSVLSSSSSWFFF